MPLHFPEWKGTGRYKKNTDNYRIHRHLAPSIFTGDSADATIASYVLGIPHPPGFPVYAWIGHLFTFIPVGDIAYRVNLMSAFFGALVIPIVYMIIRLSAPQPGDGFEYCVISLRRHNRIHVVSILHLLLGSGRDCRSNIHSTHSS